MPCAGYDGWQNDYFDYEPPEEDVCPNCGGGSLNQDTNEYGDLVIRCGDCGYSEAFHLDFDPPVIVELSEF